MLHVPSGKYFGLNRSGLVVWKALAAGEDPVVALHRQWPDVAEDAHRADVDALVGALQGAGLVGTGSGSAE